jgi:hypothetical protein
MKKNLFISIGIIFLLVVVPLFAHAASFISNTKSFGGKILSTTIPLVTCSGIGTGPVVLIRNLTVMPSTFLPFYAQTNYSNYPFTSGTPKAGDWILGTASAMLDTTTCSIQVGEFKIPFPVHDTNYYKTSGN